MYIALDAMGGDYAPQSNVEGAVLFAREFNIGVYLVGNKDLLEKELKKYDTKDLPVEIVHAEEVIDMDEPPSIAVRKKRKSSMHIAAKLVREGKASGFVSAGNTGAAMAISKFVVGAAEGIERPGIAVAFPTKKEKPTVLIDVGANVDCRPRHLIYFAVMGHTYAKEILRVSDNPKVGILSIGEEEGKGNDLVKDTYPLLKMTKLNFIGNAEGRDIFTGDFDVIVCDGFVGNIVLKTSESLGSIIVEMIKNEVKKSLVSKIGAALMIPALKRFKRKADFAEYGGAPLLGTKGTCIITHGRADSRAIKNALKAASDFEKTHFNDRLKENIDNLLPEELKG
ncbi:MAG TPA: phosphate acyltransferase PlsX [Persephonella sp.]|uniref:Phosphate acyltransferase n=1 Tax=Persephonella marina (strain DSM 14350 / EX-H1) TaxID=123214 RepID=C0QPF5_PERMH|nr:MULTISPECIES: phosphate acyltransferase PlsX [Persephonella]ACO03823.1 fatty acid/phospholipid synthesis protein PlsX [Persephonella marina EX-H1]HCB69834.1 phosphate acyltransferase PlsX [Persephonella sp.]